MRAFDIRLCVHSTYPEGLASFEVGTPDRVQGLALLPQHGFNRREHRDFHLLSLAPSGRHYEEDAWAFRISDPKVRGRKDLVAEVTFWDEGFGIIAARRLVDDAFNGRYEAASRSASYARVNSQRFRQAAFQFTQAPAETSPSDKPDLELTGVQHLRSIRLLSEVPESYWTDLQSKIPVDVQPAVFLHRPMEIVCTAGVEVLGRQGLLERSVQNLREQLPLAKALGFNAIEAYVRWDMVEPELGRFDWSFYDGIVAELQRYGFKLFPLLIVGSAYSLPEWFFNSEENVGFVCVEHGLGNPIQSIWSPWHMKHVVRFLQAFGAHYEPMGCLAGVRLGPSGNYGESQYPASGDWGFRGEKMHLHIGFWAGDPHALADFQHSMKKKYGSIASLNQAWEQGFRSFEEIPMKLPEQCVSKRQRVDLHTWYTDSMSAWCEAWAIEARKAMPNTPIYQSAGGWGAAEIGTDYSAQTKSMLKVKGGIRLTNELDSFHQAIYATRLAATAARCYGVPLGFEPAMGHTDRGTAGRIFNCISNGGDHFFIYSGNIFNRQTSIENWLKHYPLFEGRYAPMVEVALYYPQTMNFLSLDAFRYLNAWGFNPVARVIRDRLEVDYLDDRLILDGFLDRYKVLVFVWGNQIEKDVLQRIDSWLRKGHAIIFPYFLNTALMTLEGDASVFKAWQAGDVGQGKFHRYVGDDEPPDLYADFVKASLLGLSGLSQPTRIALEMEKPDKVFVSACQDGTALILNFSDHPAKVTHPSFGTIEIGPYEIHRFAGLACPVPWASCP